MFLDNIKDKRVEKKNHLGKSTVSQGKTIPSKYSHISPGHCLPVEINIH